MYIQITTKCNMTCEHCGFSCTENGIHMKRNTFKKVLELDNFGLDISCITLGGGEPTMHPLLMDFVGNILAHRSNDYLHIITNGKNKNVALDLAHLSNKTEYFSCSVSQDYYHEPIDDIVTDTYMRLFGNAGFHNVREVIKSGRAEENGIWEVDNRCLCDDFYITPLGEIYSCACKTEFLGTVDNPNIPEEIWERYQDTGSTCPNHNS